jgi:hypothetical protein
VAVSLFIGGCGADPLASGDSSFTTVALLAPSSSVDAPTDAVVHTSSSVLASVPAPSSTIEVVPSATVSTSTSVVASREVSSTQLGGTQLEQPAIWPAAEVVFADPVDAAADFMGGDHTALGEFEMHGERIGEIVVHRLDEDDQVTTLDRSRLLMRQLAPTNGWYVISALSPEASISHPQAGALVAAGPVEISGEARGYEANMIYAAFLPGDSAVRYDMGHTTVGFYDPEPYAVAVDLSAVPAGTTVVLRVQADDGIGQGGFSAVPVVVLDEIPATD